MPLTVLLPLVVIGIAGIAAILHLLGYSRAYSFASDADARAAWAREFPGDRTDGATVCASGRAALVDTTRGPGLVWAMGADTACRVLDGGRASLTSSGLTIRFPDFNAPRVSLAMPPAEARAWAARINGDTP